MSTALRLRQAAATAVLSGLLLFSFVRAVGQQPAAAAMGRIHGRVTNPTGVPQTNGTVSLSTDGGTTLSYNFPVSAAGEYAGEAPEGEYTVVYRAPDTPEGKIVDYISGVEVVAGQDTAQDIDMTRQEYIDRLSPDLQKQLQEMKAANAASLAANGGTTDVDADIKTAIQDLEDAENARATAKRKLGAAVSGADIDDMTTEIANAKYSEIEALMSRDTNANPGDPVLWIYLGRAEAGLKNYLDAESSYKKAIDLASKAATPEPRVLASAEAGLGEVYARTLMVDDANAAFDAAAKADPPNAAMYLRNQALIFFEEWNFPAQVDAADEAIKADPSQAILYYLKGAGLAESASVDPDTNKLVLPPGCAAAFRKYLELAPTGPYADQVKAILQRAGEEDGASSAPAAK